MLAAFAAVARWLVSAHGDAGLWAALVGWLLCTTAALVALIVSASFAHTQHALSANLGVMLVRMGAPLVGLVVLPKQFPHLAEAGLSHAILAMYLVALAAETLLALRHAAGTAAASGASSRPLGAK